MRSATLLVHPGEVFRGAIIAGASAIVLMQNHPSGEPQPAEADIKVTRDLIRAGHLLKIEVLDYDVIGNPNHCSLRGLGYSVALFDNAEHTGRFLKSLRNLPFFIFQLGIISSCSRAELHREHFLCSKNISLTLVRELKCWSVAVL
jgi:hypothetical protein